MEEHHIHNTVYIYITVAAMIWGNTGCWLGVGISEAGAAETNEVGGGHLDLFNRLGTP
jgi:hypothetical protein